MHRPSILRLLLLFARTAGVRFRNRFALARQKRKEAKRKKLGLPVPERTATAHRNQRIRAGSILGALFMAYLLVVFVFVVIVSLGKAMSGVLEIRQPPVSAQILEQQQTLPPEMQRALERERPESPGDTIGRMNVDTLRAAHRVAGLLMTIAGVGTLLFAVGLLSRQISRPEPSLAWLFEFPVPRGVLFTSKLSECLFDGASLPLLSMLPGVFLFQCGHGFWASTLWGLAFGVAAALAIAAMRITMEVFLLQKVARRRRGTICGLCTAVGTLLMVVVLYGGGTPSLLRILLAGADFLPDWFYLNPFANGFGLQLPALSLQWFTAAGLAVALCVVGVTVCAGLTRFGLEPGLETARGATPLAEVPARPASPARRPLFTGLLGKEMYMLVRQRAVLVNVLLAPVIMFLMLYFQSSGRLAERALGSAGAMASMIYGISAYMVLIASQLAMNTELRTLWLLLSLPRPLADSLRVKSLIWGVAAAGLALVMGVLAVMTRPEMTWGLLYRLPFIIILVALIADVSVGIRTMGSSIISETTVHFKQWAQWLPLMLSAAAGQAVFDGKMWMLCVQLVLLGALDVSVWQKLNAELSYLTEPAEDPPPRLFLMHGLLAAYGYFALQALGIAIAVASKAPPQTILPAASAVAAAAVAFIAFWQLTRRRVRIFPDKRASAVAGALLAGAGVIVTGLIGWGWLHLLKKLAAFHATSLAEAPVNVMIGIGVFAIIVAPVCEEFIFRGLVYHGLRRSHGFLWSLLWSSLFFTAVHPVESSVAVFGLAAVNAWIMERTGRLTPCILIHAGYNAFVLWLQTWM